MTGSWKPIGCIGHSPMSWKHVSMNGTMYWFLISSEKEAIYPGSILTVDMQENLEQLIFQIPEYLLLQRVHLDQEMQCGDACLRKWTCFLSSCQKE